MSHLCNDEWKITFSELNTYIKNEKKCPNYDNEPLYSSWLCEQNILYKAKKRPFNVKDVYDFWSKFIEEIKIIVNEKDFNATFNCFNCFNYLSWEDKLNELKKFIDIHKRDPKYENDDNEGFMELFILDNNEKYYWFEQEFNTKPFVNKQYKEWENFLEHYATYCSNINRNQIITSLITDNKWNDRYLDLKKFTLE